MKVAITSKGPNPADEVSPSLGDCSHLVLVDTVRGSWHSHKNTSLVSPRGNTASSSSGPAPKPCADVIIAGDITEREARSLCGMKVNVFRCPSGSVREAVNKYLRGDLPEVKIDHSSWGRGRAKGRKG